MQNRIPIGTVQKRTGQSLSVVYHTVDTIDIDVSNLDRVIKTEGDRDIQFDFINYINAYASEILFDKYCPFRWQQVKILVENFAKDMKYNIESNLPLEYQDILKRL